MKSKDLIASQFDHNVNIALGNALTEVNEKHELDLEVAEFSSCGLETTRKYIEIDKGELSGFPLSDFKEEVSCAMACYGMGKDYSIDLLDVDTEPIVPMENLLCTPYTGSKESEDKAHILGVTLTPKKTYLFHNMKYMVASMIGVFLLLAFVLFWILRSLIRQKTITENNIDFFNNTAHELKTPLTNISLATKLLARQDGSLENNKYLEIIKSENTKLTDQIERVLYLSRMENGEYTLKKENFSINELVADIIENLKMIIESKKGKINVELLAQDAQIVGDRFHLGNVFKNLIDNALKYCDKDPVIDIKLTEEEEGIKMTFIDNGIGISKKDQEHIFQKFQRVNTGDIRQASGFGIGLSYVKTVVEMHKGIIRVLSDLNKGSQFELYIPTK